MAEFMIGVVLGGLFMSLAVVISMAKAAKYGDETECEIITQERNNKYTSRN